MSGPGMTETVPAQGIKDGWRLGNQIAQVLSRIFFLLTRPLVLVTQVLFRKQMGERYFTPLQAGFSAALILIANAVTVIVCNPLWQNDYYYYPNSPAHVRAAFAGIVGDLWFIVFLLITGWHFRVTVPRRRKQDIRWYSRSDGLPRLPIPAFWGIDQVQCQLLFEVAVVVVLAIAAFCLRFYGFGVLLALSALITYAADAEERKRFHQRVLDAADGEIESQWLAEAIERRLSPDKTEGLKVSLPAACSKAYRQRVANLFR
jgi:hypothetical protein